MRGDLEVVREEGNDFVAKVPEREISVTSESRSPKCFLFL
jgi:hypothetical protein